MGRIDKNILVGTNGKVYVDGDLEAYIESISVKVTGNFEDVDLCGDFETHHVYTGYSVEGEMTIHKVATKYDDDVLESFTTGVMPERTIVATLTNQNTSKTASYSIPNVVYTEITPVEIKKGKLTQTLPFKCSIPIKLNGIS